MSHYKGFLSAINYVIDKKDYWYQIILDGNINGKWEILLDSDEDYAGDSNTRKIVIG